MSMLKPKYKKHTDCTGTEYSSVRLFVDNKQVGYMEFKTEHISEQAINECFKKTIFEIALNCKGVV